MLARRREVYCKQLAWLQMIFREGGFVGDDVDTRVHLSVCHFTWERIMFPGQAKARAKRLIKR